MFEPINFQNLNEQDVREEIIAPLIRKLGYKSGGQHNVIREQSLRYPRAFIGRKNNRKDPLLRGSADYILEADGAVRWVIEAKAPDVLIDLDSIDQAYTYANHPEVRAVYFAICNGKKLLVFQTNKGPDATAFINFNYEDLGDNYQILENMLSPLSILRDHPNIEPDNGTPIAHGFRSLVRVTNGVIVYHENSMNLPVLREMQTGISGGAIERDENGLMIAYLTTIAPTRSMQQLNQRLGITSFEMRSDDNSISIDPSTPTLFLIDKIITLPAGERLLDMNSWREVTIPFNITCEIKMRALGYLDGNRFHGKFTSIMNYQEYDQKVGLNGYFEIFIA